MWQMWGKWKNKVLLYPPKVRGYSKKARAIDTSIFKSLLWSQSPTTLSLGKHERESRRFLHWRSAAIRLCCPKFTSGCQKGRFRCKQVVMHVRQVSSSPRSWTSLRPALTQSWRRALTCASTVASRSRRAMRGPPLATIARSAMRRRPGLQLHGQPAFPITHRHNCSFRWLFLLSGSA